MSTTVEDITLKDVRRLHLGPDDVLVVRLNAKHVPSDAVAALGADLHKWFPDNKTLILTPDTDIEVITKAEGINATSP